MISLRQLQERHGSLLVIDASSSVIHAGLWERGAGWRWESLADEAGRGVFAAVETLGATKVKDVETFLYCDAPGSVLGIRTTAVALRVWNAVRARPLYAYNGLVCLAHQAVAEGRIAEGFVVADARRDSWHTVEVRGGAVKPGMERVPTAHLAAPLFTPQGFRRWGTLPSPPSEWPYQPSVFLEQTASLPLLLETPEPDAFLHEEPSYKTWTPQVHRAPEGTP